MHNFDERGDHAFFSPVRGGLLPRTQGYRYERTPSLAGILEVLEGGEAFRVVPHHDGLDPLAKDRFHGPFIGRVGFDEFADHSEYPPFASAVAVPFPEVMVQDGPDAG